MGARRGVCNVMGVCERWGLPPSAPLGRHLPLGGRQDNPSVIRIANDTSLYTREARRDEVGHCHPERSEGSAWLVRGLVDPSDCVLRMTDYEERGRAARPTGEQ